MTLSLTEHAYWFDAIKIDDDVAVRRHLSSCNSEVKGNLLNGEFNFFHLEEVSHFSAPAYRLRRPFSLAAAFGSLRVCQAMIQYGVDVCSTEADGCNVFHCLVCIVFMQENLEEKVIESFRNLSKILPSKTLLDLMKTEEKHGLRPLEFAVHHGTLKLALAIFETRDLYIMREEIVGISVYRWYDITEYQILDAPNSRHIVSPIQFLIYTEQKYLKIENQDGHADGRTSIGLAR